MHEITFFTQLASMPATAVLLWIGWNTYKAARVLESVVHVLVNHEDRLRTIEGKPKLKEMKHA